MRLLISHATGFHGRAYTPLAAALGDRFDVWALDHRGHGVTSAPPGWEASWTEYGDDAEAAARALLAAGTGARFIGFGHSMGGDTLLMAADRRPGMFSTLVLFEPIAAPPQPDEVDPESSPVVLGARRRRRQFDSFDAAIANFASKPPMDAFTPAALEAYVRGGFEAVDSDRPDGPVRLCCSPELEAETFARGHQHDTWDRLPGIATPTVVVAGGLDPSAGPAALAPLIAERLPHGTFEQHPELDHFGPFTRPDAVATIIRDTLAAR